jgi:peptide/nickel transport system permease protein
VRWYNRRPGELINNHVGPIIQGVILLFSAAYVLVNLAVDISYTLLDPRVRY